MKAKTVKLRLTLDLTYKTTGTDADGLQAILKDAINRVVDSNALTEDTNAEIVRHDMTTAELRRVWK